MVLKGKPKTKVLCVDDDRNLLDAVRLALRQDFEVITAVSGEGGLALLNENPDTAVVISDMRMPEMSGSEFLAHVRERTPSAVRVLMTGHGDFETAVRAIHEGRVFRFIVKPCQPDELVSTLKLCARQHRLLRVEERLATRTHELQEANEQLQQARRHAERANRAKSDFVASMSHEIRTPLSAVVGMVEILAHSDLDAGQTETVTMIRQASQTLLRLIDNILDFSKIEAGRIELEQAPVMVDEVAKEICASLETVAADRGVELALTVSGAESNPVVTDQTRISQILYNLIGNAIKFSGGDEAAQGHVRVDITLVKGASPRLEVRVADDGVGMAPDTQAKIFGSFEQADASTTRRFGGTGLGLAITKRLVDLMDGTVSVASGLGQGSVFRVELPVQELSEGSNVTKPSTAHAATEERQSDPETPSEKKLILVAEDDRMNQRVIAKQLELLGYEAEVVDDGLEALSRWRHGRYDLLLSDLQLPLMDGYTLTEMIRREERHGSHIPILAITANAVPEEAVRAKEIGMDDYLTKPVQLQHLRDVLARWLWRPNPGVVVDAAEQMTLVHPGQ